MSSPVLDARGVSVTHQTRVVLDAVDLRVDRESRIALIGPGRSAMLRVLAGIEPAWSGAVYRRGHVGYLSSGAVPPGIAHCDAVLLDEPTAPLLDRVLTQARGGVVIATGDPGVRRLAIEVVDLQAGAQGVRARA